MRFSSNNREPRQCLVDLVAILRQYRNPYKTPDRVQFERIGVIEIREERNK